VIRKSVLSLALLATTLGTVAVSTAGASASVAPHKVTTVTFTGKLTCKVASTSTITIKPGLMLVTKRKVTLTTTVTLTGCTGKTSQGGAKILSGLATGKATADTSCAGLLTPPLPSPKGKIVWKTKGNHATNTTFTLSKGALNSKTGTETYSSTQKGSFAGKGTSSLKVKQTTSQLETACESKTGLTKINIASGKVAN
jgi:hypothetical protein